MPKEVHYWECSICRQQFSSEKEASICESRGIPKPPPVGIIHGNNRPGAFYSDIIFCTVSETMYSAPQGHHLRKVMWACRDNGVGDSLGEEYCGGDYFSNFSELCENESYINRNMPAYQRMVSWLISQKIQPKILNKDGTYQEINLDGSLGEKKMLS